VLTGIEPTTSGFYKTSVVAARTTIRPLSLPYSLHHFWSSNAGHPSSAISINQSFIYPHLLILALFLMTSQRYFLFSFPEKKDGLTDFLFVRNLFLGIL